MTCEAMQNPTNKTVKRKLKKLRTVCAECGVKNGEGHEQWCSKK